MVPRLDLGLGCAEDLFDLEFFVHDPEPFFKFAKVRFTTVNKLISVLLWVCSKHQPLVVSM